MSTPIFQLDKSLPFAADVNPIIASSQRLSFASQYNEILQGYPSDQLAGKMTPGCATLHYNKTSEVQSLILAWYEKQSEAGAQQGGLPEDMQDILEANPGPTPEGTANAWNGSYEYWGVVPGIGAGFKTLYTVEVGTARAVTVILPS